MFETAKFLWQGVMKLGVWNTLRAVFPIHTCNQRVTLAALRGFCFQKKDGRNSVSRLDWITVTGFALWKHLAIEKALRKTGFVRCNDYFHFAPTSGSWRERLEQALAYHDEKNR
jgi:hypothetical protein